MQKANKLSMAETKAALKGRKYKKSSIFFPSSRHCVIVNIIRSRECKGQYIIKGHAINNKNYKSEYIISGECLQSLLRYGLYREYRELEGCDCSIYHTIINN